MELIDNTSYTHGSIMIYHRFSMDFPIKSSMFFSQGNGPDSRLSALHLFIAAVALAAQPQVVGLMPEKWHF